MKKILVATDFGEKSTWALQAAHKWAGAGLLGLILIHIDDKLPLIMNMAGYGPETEKQDFKNKNVASHYQVSFREQLEKAGLTLSEVEVLAFHGIDPVETLYHFLQERREEIEMVFLGSHRKRFMEFSFLGGFTERLIPLCRIPMVVVKDQSVSTPRNILLTCDFTSLNELTLEWTLNLAKQFHARIHFLHLLDSSGEEIFDKMAGKKYTGLLTSMKERVAKIGSTGDVHLLISFPGKTQEAFHQILNDQQIDLLVLGNWTGFKKGRIGGTALKLARYCHKSFAIFNTEKTLPD